MVSSFCKSKLEGMMLYYKSIIGLHVFILFAYILKSSDAEIQISIMFMYIKRS